MTNQALRIQPSTLQSAAGALQRLEASELAACLAELRQLQQSLGAHWSGAAASAYDGRFGGWLSRYGAQGREIAAIARYLQRVVAGYHETERRLTDVDLFDDLALAGASSGASKVLGRPIALDADGTIGLVDLAWWAQAWYGKNWVKYFQAWQADVPFMRAMELLKPGYSIQLGNDPYSRVFVQVDTDGTVYFTDAGRHFIPFTELAGKGPYKILDTNSRLIADPTTNFGGSGGWLSTSGYEGYQPVYDYSSGVPTFTGEWRAYTPQITDIQVTPKEVALLGGSVATLSKGGTTVLEVSAAQAMRVLGPRAAALLPAATGVGTAATVVMLVASVDSAGTVYLDGYSETTLPDGFWNQPGWRMDPVTPGQPGAVDVQPAPWANPSGPSYPGVPSSVR